MGKRRSGGSGSGGGKKQSNSDRILRRHIIEAAGKNYSSVEQVVDHLRSSYPHYARLKLRPFTKQVERVTMAEGSNDDGDTPIAMKRRKIDNKEEKLQLNCGGGGGCSSSASAISSGGGGSSDEETSSTSDDAINGEPKFDLMKSMVRENLRRKLKKLGEGRAVNCKEAVELEGVDSKGMKKEVTLMNGESKLGDKILNENYWNRSSGKDGNVIEDKPMFKDLGGMSRVIEELKLDVIVPLLHPQLMPRLGVKPTAGILLHGPPGCGKSKLARAIANETGVPFYKISAPDVVSGVSGESEENIRELFSKAYRTAPSIVLIEEIDAIASKRDNMGREMEKRIVTQLLTSMDESHVHVKPVGDDAAPGSSDCRPGYVLVIGTTNRPDALDPALRRPGRFDREIALGVPNEAARIEILSVLIRKVRVEGDLDIRKIARLTPGFAGADLTALASMAARFAIKRILHGREVELSKEEKDGDHSEECLRRPWSDIEIENLSMELLRRPWSDEEIENLILTMADFEEAAKKVQPSTRREGFSDIPDVTWDDVGGLHLLRQEFDRFIVRRIKFPEKYEKFGKRSATGFLLYGPPGCGKTLIAKAVANEAGANFIHIKGPELMNKYVGESELAVRTIFSRARTCSPCILFFDELDALTRKHGQDEGGCPERVLKQLLIELDGAEQRRGVYVIGATNRPKVMDDALLRPGRFGKLMYVTLPTPDERGMILKALARELPIDADVDLIALGKGTRCHNLSGADLSALMDEALEAAVDDDFSSTDTSCSLPQTIKDAHFTSALENISPSVSDKQIRYYERLSKKFKAGKRRA